MNAHTFDSHSATCPICQRAGGVRPGRIVNGLFRCQYCQERLVISWSGHYVRDPFTLRQLSVGRMLRRQSRPLARIWRDVGLNKQSPLVAILGSCFLLGLTIATLKGMPTSQLPAPNPIEQTTETTEPPEQPLP